MSNWVSHIYEHVPFLHATVPEVLCVHVYTIYIATVKTQLSAPLF